MQNSNEGTFDRFAYATKRPRKVNQCKTDNDFRLQKGKSMPSMPTLLMMLSILKPEMIYTLTNGKVSEVNEMFKNLGVDLFM